jgi:hypothetical protein
MTVFKNLIGQRITGVFLGNDAWTVVFRTTEGRYFRYDTENDCCNSVYVNHITGVDAVVGDGNSFDLLRGAVVTGGEDKEWTDDRDGSSEGCEVISDGFFTLHTDRGYIDIEVRNDHNGYYGGRFVEFTGDFALADVEDLKEVVEDF